MQVIHRIVGVPNVSGPAEVTGHDHLMRIRRQVERDTAHLGEVTRDLLGKCGLRMAPTRDLGDVQRQCAHPFDVSDDLDGADDGPQISCEWGLLRQQGESRLFDSGTGKQDFLVLTDDLLCRAQIGVKQRLR